jgi:hypothetical protein
MIMDDEIGQNTGCRYAVFSIATLYSGGPMFDYPYILN